MQIIIRFHLLALILLFIILSFTDESIYLYYTEDDSSVEFYDCIFHQSFLYCRRPIEPISLYQNKTPWECYHDGTSRSFAWLRMNNISVNTILHKWKSTIEMAELYSRYIKQPEKWKNDNESYICQCNHQQTFGKHCEYKLPRGVTFEEAIKRELEARDDAPHLVQLYGDILCYKTLKCNSGLLCLDWRNICDGIQQCMYGYDEENCDKLEFNECEDNEYRCMNGMCIPNEYFVDGEYDCMDLTDEKGFFNNTICTFQEVSLECDERICISNEWSCGDGQCINNRLAFQDITSSSLECNNRRDQYYMCELNSRDSLWTLPNGRCYSESSYEEKIIHNRSTIEECIYFFKCAFSEGNEINCPCKTNQSCIEQLENPCPLEVVQYPYGTIITPYILYYYNNSRDWSEYRPDLIQINGSIKCRGYMINHQIKLTSLNDFNFRNFENFLCLSSFNDSTIINHNGYDQFCNNDSQTFNNRSYNFFDICNHSKECISAYRIEDGFYNCADKSDEQQNEIVTNACFKIKHHRFRCSTDEPTCLSVNNLGDLWTDCKNQFDESYMGTGTTLSKLNCNSHSKDDCELIRQYIETSWNIDYSSIKIVTSTKTIPFRAYCDTFWDLHSKIDEDVDLCQTWWKCLEDQWKCRTGQCIKAEWVLDGEWDCSDASDEQEIYVFDHELSPENSEIVDESVLEDRFKKYYDEQPLSSICDLKTEFACFRINTSDPWINLTQNRPCINLTKVGDGHIDCIGGLDEQNTLEYCHQATMLGHHFKCMTDDTCIPYIHICDIRCPNRFDDYYLCTAPHRSPDCSDQEKDFTCFDGTCAKSKWCDGKKQCLHGEDEYLCNDPYDIFDKPSDLIYRRKKEFGIKYNEQLFQLPRIPTDKNKVIHIPTNSTILKKSMKDFPLLVNEPAEVDFNCNRGIGVLLHNDSIVCFCPQQYYGDKCQYYNDRITLIFHLNFSQSIYTESKNSTILLKMLVLFMSEGQILSSYEFHARPALEMTTYSKKIDHIVYSRSNKSLHNKRKRYFNRSNIIHEQPYSIRIEAYDIKLARKAELLSVWQYPIYFDYLPSFRFAKVLHLIKTQIYEDPCSSNPCNEYQECRQLLNDKSNYVCLCRNNYRGDNCTELDKLCLDDFCSSDALCKPTYRGLLNRNELPYCICPTNKFGFRCDLEYNQCNTNPCKNNGTCFPTSNPDRYFCVCNDLYHGELCEIEKVTLQFYITKSIYHKNAVVQYFNIDFSTLELVLIHQHPYYTLPNFLYYKNIGKTSPEIVIVKLYFDNQINIHLILLHIEITSINETTEVSEDNRCIPVSKLFKPNKEISPIKYHHLCRNNISLLCFSDDVYLCICDENHIRAECFIFNHNLDRCSRCLAGGLCLKGDTVQTDDFICSCPRCHDGRLCQFSSEQLSFTLDSLIVHDYLGIQLLYLILATIIIFIGGATNYASFVTFKRQNPRKIGVGNYLLIFSIFSQCSLTMLFLKVIHIVLDLSVGDIQCKIIAYMLSVTTRYTYWLTSWITIERVCFIIFPFTNPLKNPRLAIVISFITFVIVAGMHIHELLYYIALKDPNGQTLCVFEMTEKLSKYNRISVLIHYMVPFCIQSISITLLIILTAQSRSNTAANGSTFIEQLRRQFKNQKDLYIAPIIIVLSGLPHIILSFSLACITLLKWQRHAILVAYFLSHAPQLLGFILFVLPSTSYVKEFQKTWLAKRYLYRWVSTSYKRSTMSIHSRAMIIKKLNL